MWHPGLVARRMAGDRTLVLAACATALFATTVLAALYGYTGSVTREGLRRTLAEAAFDSAGTRIAGHVPSGGLDAARAQVDGALRQVYRDIPLTVSVGVRSDSYTLPGQERSEHPELTAFESFTGIEQHARLTQGRWPGGNAARGAEVEAVLPGAAARTLRVGVGDPLSLRGRVDTASAVRVKVVGLFEVNRQDDYFWQGDRLITTGAERLDYTTYGPFVVRPEVFAGRFTGSGADARWTVMPDLRHVDTGDLAALGRRVAGTRAALEKGGGTQYTTVTNLPALTDRLHGAVMVARSTMLIPVLQLVMLAGYAWVLVARLLADHRRGGVALLRTRGAGMRQLAWLGLAEGALIVLPAAVLGPLLAAPLLRLAGRAPAVRAAGLDLDAGPLAPLWAVSAVTAVACAVALTVPTLRGANRTFVEVQAGMGRTARSRLRGSGGDLALLLVAALAVWQLSRYGASGTGGTSGADGAAGGTSGIDPVIVSGPALALLAGGVLLLRLVPVASRIAERVTAGGRGLAPALGARQVGRRPLRYAGPALLLVMAMAVGVLSVTTMATWRRSQSDQADFQTGADLRLERSGKPGAPAALGQGGRFAALPGVTAATAVLREDANVGSTAGTLLAADTRALAPILRVGPGLRDGLRLGELARARPAVPALAFPGRPGRLLFDLRLRRLPGKPPPQLDPDPPPLRGTYQVAATIEDARGLAQRVVLDGLRPDGRTRTVAVDSAELAGPGGLPSYPLSLRGLHYVFDDNDRSGPLELGVLRVRGEGTGDATAPAGIRWNLLQEPADDPRSPEAAGKGAGSVTPTLRIPATPGVHGWDIGTGRTLHAMAATSPPGPRRPAGERVQPAVPGVITAETARRARVGAGGTVTLDTADGGQPVRVAGIVRALPGTPPGRPAVLVDLPTLTELRLAAASAAPGSTRPGEWWASARDGRTAPAARAMAAHPAWGTVAGDRAALRSRLRDAPLGAALQGALVLGFGAALVFAFIAFAVNAAVSVRERAREFAVLRVLGVRPRQMTGMLAVEQAFLVAVGLLGGLLLGLVVARLVIPHIVLGVQAAPPYPPADLVVRWPVVLAMLGGVAAGFGLVLPLVIRVLRRRDLGAGLRAGEDG
ncbi:FtsX-like permease family protein [Actinomadura graeca]|uniref:FtsX-like permease family protein n=1 Tax=Actinomadura graeca TaxID=2750812 RepID=A0ABX8QZD4_9ACTN|nr:FtsX-like permease family protein [Actinomadura graeca]QXJ24205.1 FtsX-like permease family protein [Actinomadura graeca]